MEFLPAKAVASIKPDKLKARIVACGNYATGDPSEDLDISAGGIDSIAIRGVLHAAARRGYKAGTVDVKCAFLQAPGRGRCKVRVVEPPSILRQMQLVEKDEKWLVNCALYGFQESPGDWGAFRDKTLRDLSGAAAARPARWRKHRRDTCGEWWQIRRPSGSWRSTSMTPSRWRNQNMSRISS